MVIPVPEYPFVYKKAMNDDESIKHPYAEDGSLKVLKLAIFFFSVLGIASTHGLKLAPTNIGGSVVLCYPI